MQLGTGLRGTYEGGEEGRTHVCRDVKVRETPPANVRVTPASGLLSFAAASLLFLSSCGGDGGSEERFPTGASLRLTWDAPATNSDGSALTDLRGFNIHDGTSPGEYTMVTDVGPVTEFTFDSLAPGTHYFAITAYDVYGNESDFSEQVVATVTSR